MFTFGSTITCVETGPLIESARILTRIDFSSVVNDFFYLYSMEYRHCLLLLLLFVVVMYSSSHRQFYLHSTTLEYCSVVFGMAAVYEKENSYNNKQQQVLLLDLDLEVIVLWMLRYLRSVMLWVTVVEVVQVVVVDSHVDASNVKLDFAQVIAWLPFLLSEVN